MTGKEILNLPMEPGDVGATTIREYLILLLRQLWEEKSKFSGKRPFGSGSWYLDLYKPLIVAKCITGSLDEEGCVNDVDEDAGDTLIDLAIESLGGEYAH